MAVDSSTSGTPTKDDFRRKVLEALLEIMEDKKVD